jgi:hypothetical protein
MELNELLHPLATSNSLNYITESETTVFEGISLTRTCTPWDRFPAAAFSNDNDSPMEIMQQDKDIGVVFEASKPCSTAEIDSNPMNEGDGHSKTIGVDNEEKSILADFKSLNAKGGSLRRRRSSLRWKSLKACTNRMTVPVASVGSHSQSDEILFLPSRGEMSMNPTNHEAKSETHPIPFRHHVCSMPSVSKDVGIAPTMTKQPSLPTTSTKVSFNETMEVRYFYRSDDEIAIMKRCALERRLQLETRRRLRRRMRKAKQQLNEATRSSSMRIKKKFASLFYNGCISDGNGMENDSRDEGDSDDDTLDGSNVGGIFHCGIHFQQHDDQSDDGNDDDVSLNYMGNPVTSIPRTKSMSTDIAANTRRVTHQNKNSVLQNMVSGLSAMISDVMIDVKSTLEPNKSEKEVRLPVDNHAPTMPTSPAVTDVDEDMADPWILSTLICGNTGTVIALKE